MAGENGMGVSNIRFRGKIIMPKPVSALGAFAILLGGLFSLVRAWSTGGCIALPLRVHAGIAENVLDHPSIRPYLARFGLDRSEIVSRARIEPECYLGFHPSLKDFMNQSYLSWPLTNQTIGAILHVAGDSGVAACHSPANEVWCDNTAERILEQNAELNAVPALGPLYSGSFTAKLTSFHNEAVALARRYQTWWAKKPANCPPDCRIDAFVRQSEVLGQKLGQAALLFYFEKRAALAKN